MVYEWHPLISEIQNTATEYYSFVNQTFNAKSLLVKYVKKTMPGVININLRSMFESWQVNICMFFPSLLVNIRIFDLYSF